MDIENNDAKADSSSETEEGNESNEPKETEAKPPQEGENTPVKEEPQPLHRDERFREVYRGYKEGQRKIADLERRLGELSEAKPVATEPSAPPDWFTDAFGDNPALYRNYTAHTKAEREAIKSELRDELRRESQAEKEADVSAQRFIESQLDEMEEDGIEYDRNALVKFAYENPVVGEDGNLNLRKSLELMNRIKSAAPDATVQARKSLSASGNSRGAEPKPKEAYSDKDFAGRGWGGIK